MSAEQLKRELQQLHDALGATESVNADLKTLLRDLDEVIRRLLDSDDGPPPDETLKARIDDAVNDFAIKHPQVSGILQRLSDALSQIGI